MARLSYVNIFAQSIDALFDFYSKVFGFTEIVESRTAMHRGLACGGDASLSLSAPEAYDVLGLRKPRGKGERKMITFDLDSPAEVREVCARAQEHGATVIKEPFETYYFWYQAVLRDPEGNAFRLNYPGKDA